MLKIRHCFLPALLAAAVIASGPTASIAAEPALPFGVDSKRLVGDENLPFLLEADTVRYDQKADTIVAEGDVQITRQGRVLTADHVEFRRAEKIVAAKGNVTLVETTGEVLFADEVELTEDLDQGFAVAPRILLPDGSRLAANAATRQSRDRFEIKRGVYSPCLIDPICPDRPPLWQVRAETMTHSETRRELEFYDASLDVFGVPVAWFPYFSQPDPRVKRKTGFLVPTFGSDSDLGFVARVPFFWNIAPNQDVTLTPIVTSEQYPVGLVDFRHLFPWGETEVEGSFGMVERTENGQSRGTNARGHIKWTGNANIDDNWRSRFQLYRSSDDTYLRLFKIDSAGVLRSFGTVEGFYPNAYINGTVFSVQEQRFNFSENDTPDAFPYITADYQVPIGNTGFTLTGKAGFQSLFRSSGPDSQHLAAQVGVGREWNFGGHLIQADASVRGDVFYAQDLTTTSSGDKFIGRFLPRATVDWSYPLFRTLGEDGVLTLTPRAMATATIGSVNSSELPNEDSQSVEFDATALFRPAIATGRDRIDDGQRFDYGLEATYDLTGVQLSGLVGQSYHINSSRDFGAGTGLDRPFSDIVVGVGARVQDWVDGAMRVRWDPSDGHVSATEARAHFGTRPIELSLSYTMLDARTADGVTIGETNQIDATLRGQFTDHWAGYLRHQRDLDVGRALRSQVGLSYADECFQFEVVYTRESLRNAEVQDNDSIVFRIALRNLGSASNSQSFARE
ncbi:MAG: LPS-assembly protein LptD [Alphaproteobacteria bacterium]|nr:LPS-assembly protein LptD [Alphaproteobacteria bacterium]MCB9929488.1 LPS-assembly protein LptD [Alphaproteobacteria bacterium]